MNAVDLFAGGGGWDVAAAALGIETLGFELDEHACRTGRAAGHARIRVDVAGQAPLDYGGCDLLIASPPCQAFSAAGKGKGRAHKSTILDGVTMLANARTPRDRADVCSTIDAWITEDDRASLVLEPLRWALDLMPLTLAWEQVPAVLPVWQACAEVLRSRGYTVDCGYLTAEQHDVAQTRKRAILVASRVRDVKLPEPRRRKYRKGVAQHEWLPGQEHLLPWISMADALGWSDIDGELLTGTRSNSTRRDMTEPAPTFAMGHDAASHRWALRSNYGTGGDPRSRGLRRSDTSKIDRNLWMAQAGATSTMDDPRPVDAPAGTITGKATAAWVHERPAPTIVGTRRSTEGMIVGRSLQGDSSHPPGCRVTVEEAATLQGFPTGYPWRGNKTAQYRQVGDAVPPPLAWHVLRAALGMPAAAWPGLNEEAAA